MKIKTESDFYQGTCSVLGKKRPAMWVKGRLDWEILGGSKFETASAAFFTKLERGEGMGDTYRKKSSLNEYVPQKYSKEMRT